MIPLSVNIKLIREEGEFQASVAIIQGELSELLLHKNMLHQKELNKLMHYKYGRRKSSYLLGRLSAKQAILKLTNTNRPESIWIDSGVFQFPVVRCTDIHNTQVSISHSQDIGFSIAFPESHPMGVDLEKIESDRKEVVLTQISNEEKTLLQQIGMNNIRGYYCLFSIKESLSKVIKTGMMLDFNFLKVNKVKMNQDVMETSFTHFGQYKAIAYLKNDYVFSLVLPRRTELHLNETSQILELIDRVFNS